jgi:hypothetical protein
VILLDIDGVLNPCPFSTERSKDWVFDPEFVAKCFQINASCEMARALLDLNHPIEWLTTWCMYDDSANQHIGPCIRMPRLKNNRTPYPDEGWWKLAVYNLKRLQFDGPIVWIDDDLAGAGLPVEYGKTAVDPLDPATLYVCPETDVGLTKAHIEAIAFFLGRFK